MLKELLGNIKKEIGKYYIPLGTGMGLPYLYENKTGLFVLIPLIQKNKINNDGIISIRKPIGEIRLDLFSGKMVLFRLYYPDDPFKNYKINEDFAYFPPLIAQTNKWDRNKYNEEREKYLSLIDEICEYKKANKYFDDRVNLVQMKFDELSEDGMDKFYKTISIK